MDWFTPLPAFSISTVEPERSREQILLGQPFVAVISFRLGPGVGEKLHEHPFWTAVGIEPFSTVTVAAMMLKGWTIYTKCVPEVENPLIWRRRLGGRSTLDPKA